jgi:hypothetical protein
MSLLGKYWHNGAIAPVIPALVGPFNARASIRLYPRVSAWYPSAFFLIGNFLLKSEIKEFTIEKKVALEGFNRQKWEEKMGNFFFQIFIFGSQCIAINFETSIKFFFLHIWFIFLKKHWYPPSRLMQCVPYLYTWLVSSSVWFFRVPDQSFCSLEKAISRTGLGTSVMQIQDTPERTNSLLR